MYTDFFRTQALGLILLACMATPLLAQSPENLAAVLDQTLRHHPVLARIDARRRQLAPVVTLARQSTPLEVELEAENIGNNGVETTLSLGGVLEWGGQVDARAEVALSNNQIALLELARDRRDVLAAVATRYIELLGAYERMHLTREVRKFAQQTHAATQRRQRVGAASDVDVQRSALALSQAELSVTEASQARNAAEKALQLAMGASLISLEGLPDNGVELQHLGALPALDELLQLAQSTPSVVLADARMQIARSRLELAQRQARPNLGWAIGVRDDRESDDQSLILGFSLPLGQSSRSRPQREQARAGIDIATQDRQIAQLEMQALLLDIWQELANLKREAEMLNERLIPQSEAIAGGMCEGYKRGRYSLLELTSAEQDLGKLRQQLLSARIHYHQSWITLERLLGRSPIQEKSS